MCLVRFDTVCHSLFLHIKNATSPPHVVGLANGLAQSLCSFARFVGPILGGLVSRCTVFFSWLCLLQSETFLDLVIFYQR